MCYSCSSSYAELSSNVLDETGAVGAANSSSKIEQNVRKRKIDVSKANFKNILFYSLQTDLDQKTFWVIFEKICFCFHL